jgi:beta-glucosidase
VTFTVTNKGARSGADVAELYVFDPRAAHEPPKQLKGYTKVLLQPGQSRTITLSLDRRAFSYWNVDKHGWRVAAGCYRIGVGDSSRALPLRGRLARGGGSCGSSG